MRLVQLELSQDNFFWFLDKTISLSENNRISDFIDIDSLKPEDKEIINRSARYGEIKLFDVSGQKIKDLDHLCFSKGEYSVSYDDVDFVDENDLPEIISVTDLEEEKIEEEKPEIDYSQLEENAKILLSKNGNTVKKIIKDFIQTDETLSLLHVMMTVEQNDKNRTGILRDIENAIREF